MGKEKLKRKLFHGTWQYKEGFVISVLLILLGIFIGFITKKPINFPEFPLNLSISISYSLLIIVLYKFERDHKIIKWLSSIPAAVTSMVLFAVTSALLGIIPQTDPGMILKDDFWFDIGFKHLSTSWLLGFSYLFFLTSLGFATIKIAYPFKFKRLGTLLSHLGLYIIILAGIAGSSDAKRTYFVLNKDAAPTNIVKDFFSDTQYKLPFKLQLVKFDISEYNPKIVLVEKKTNKLLMPESNQHFIIHKNDEENFLDWKIKIKTFYKYAYPSDSLYQEFTSTNAFASLPAAEVEVYDKNDSIIKSAWMTCGNFAWSRKNIDVNNNYYFAMLQPEAKEYSSKVKAYLPDGKTEEFLLKVNGPKMVDGWKLYQTSYNEQMGKWSNYSVIEAGKDPWLPVVYSGIFLLIAGALYLFWLGSITSKKEEEEENHNLNKK
ncbi:MAG: hypothetical protein J7K64_06210 [Bacteroidales bacterium]|nr:hypothetical protein [Bacteroidales bacterium]